MSTTLRKKITIASTCSLGLYGGTFGPIRSPFFETIPNIARLIGDGIEVYEETPQGKVRLNMTNFDKFEKEESRIAKEEDAARAQAEANAKARAEQQARIEAERKAKEEARLREEQNRNRQKHQKNNNTQQQPQQPAQEQVKADVIVEE